MSLPPGYSVRPATEQDLDEIVALANAYDVADFGRPDTAREHLIEDFRAEGFDPARDTWLILDRRGHAAAFGLVGMEHPAVLDGFGRVRPGHAGRGLGSALVAAMEERARGGANGVVLHNSITSTDAAARRLLDDRGYRLVRYFWHMERALHRSDLRILPNGPTPVLRAPAGIEEERAARAALDEAFREHWLFESSSFEAWREHLSVMSGAVLVALDGAEVVGAVTFMPTSDAGWIEEVGVREAWRGRGVGALLLRHAFAHLTELGVHEVRLNVDAGNATGATRLYERVGMHVRREWLVYEKTARA